MEFGKFARKYTCDQCGRMEKAKAPQDKFDYILEDWSTKSDMDQFIFCNLDCLQEWIKEQQVE